MSHIIVGRCLQSVQFIAAPVVMWSSNVVTAPIRQWTMILPPSNWQVMYVFQSICLSISLSIHPSVCPSVHQSVHLRIHLSVHPSVHPFVCPSIHPPIVPRSGSFQISICCYQIEPIFQKTYFEEGMKEWKVSTNYFNGLLISISLHLQIFQGWVLSWKREKALIWTWRSQMRRNWASTDVRNAKQQYTAGYNFWITWLIAEVAYCNMMSFVKKMPVLHFVKRHNKLSHAIWGIPCCFIKFPTVSSFQQFPAQLASLKTYWQH